MQIHSIPVHRYVAHADKGRALTGDPDGYMKYNRSGKLRVNGKCYREQFQVWGKPLRGSPPGMVGLFVNYRAFLPSSEPC